MRWIASLLLVAFALAGCQSSGESAAEQTREEAAARLPSWLQQVYPPPGTTSSGISAIEVDHRTTSEGREFRLLVDGVDVTTYADLRPARLHYDPEPDDPSETPGPVRLTPSEHTATVQLVELDPESLKIRLIDSYTWSFEIL
jgi:hypothetical protein